MNDTIQIANDTLKVAMKMIDSANQNPISPEMWDSLCVMGIFVVIAATIAYSVRTISSTIENSRAKSLNHEKDMHNLNKIKEERKELLKFCYDMAKKKESETREAEKEPQKDIQKLVHDKVYKTLGSALNVSDNNPPKGDEGKNTEVSSNSPKIQDITLDQIRQECWLIIKQLNGIKI